MNLICLVLVEDQLLWSMYCQMKLSNARWEMPFFIQPVSFLVVLVEHQHSKIPLTFEKYVLCSDLFMQSIWESSQEAVNWANEAGLNMVWQFGEQQVCQTLTKIEFRIQKCGSQLEAWKQWLLINWTKRMSTTNAEQRNYQRQAKSRIV